MSLVADVAVQLVRGDPDEPAELVLTENAAFEPSSHGRVGCAETFGGFVDGDEFVGGLHGYPNQGPMAQLITRSSTPTPAAARMRKKVIATIMIMQPNSPQPITSGSVAITSPQT